MYTAVRSFGRGRKVCDGLDGAHVLVRVIDDGNKVSITSEGRGEE